MVPQRISTQVGAEVFAVLRRPSMFGHRRAHSSSLVGANLVMVLIMASVSVCCSATLSWSNYSHQFDELVAQPPIGVPAGCVHGVFVTRRSL